MQGCGSGFGRVCFSAMKLARLGEGPEIFHTVQGEGVSVGVPAVFVRASRCNLHCVWCDTDYTWNFEGTPWTHEKDGQPGFRKSKKEEVTIEMAPAEVAERVLAYGCDRVVLTGGEPLLQQGDWVEVMDAVRKVRPETAFEVETNGTLVPSAEFDARISQYNVSPKLADSGNPEKLRHVPGALAFFAASPKAWFKFVIAGPERVVELDEWLKKSGLPQNRIVLMPEGRTVEALDRHAAWLAELCRDRGFRFSDRLHIRLWGERRGV